MIANFRVVIISTFTPGLKIATALTLVVLPRFTSRAKGRAVITQAPQWL
ncbi:hypothetical protein AM1_E0138 (plasmid) [Acaryochloris marina MBIC11017]|uniref:Uncharacterized protein n=1 Tax=Acaryochloris marina (strain MBIC 11017) TaxID=329726 RepID=A8ZPH1_ACAM1|nr:hypothetical protein AM1_E0138 [Acaryochloris marina MBIC11017]